jgi:CHAT domain-containing protein
MASAAPRQIYLPTEAAGSWTGHKVWHLAVALALGLLLFPLQDARPFDPGAEYSLARQLFQHGNIDKSQQAAEQGYLRYLTSNPEWAVRFRLLETEAMRLGGTYEEALRRLSALSVPLKSRESLVQKLALEGLLQNNLQHSSAADQALMEADRVCAREALRACSEVPRARGLVELGRGQFVEAQRDFLQSLSTARAHRDRWLEAVAMSNVGAALLQQQHNDEAADWLRSANRVATELNAEGLMQRSLGNLGWAYFGLGDTERALENFVQAGKDAAALGDRPARLLWLTSSGDVYRSTRDWSRAEQSYRQALPLARQLKSQDDIVNVLEDLTDASIDAGNLDAANTYLAEVVPLVHQSGNRLDAMDVTLEQGRVAAARGDEQQAEALLRTVEHDPASQVTMRLGAEHELARFYEAQGRVNDAKAMYATTLATYESARAEIKDEDSRLAFLTIASHVYDDFIHFLVKQGKTEEALAAADQSRARTLAQGLGVATNEQSFKPAALHTSAIAQKADATLLFYWLGEKQSYLWAITPSKTKLLDLPAQAEIEPMVERYRKALLQANNGRDSFNEDGLALYRTLIAPAADLIRPNGNVVIVSDGALSLLNFETLIVPGANPHYWIEDANLVSAPSLYMLASAKPSRSAGRKLLLLGDAVSPNPDYPDLPMASIEMGKIQKHFASGEETVFARQSATSDAYLAQAPQHYSYIHFVAHGVASRTDPLDSAIILSRMTAGEDSFKLHAREIIHHRIDARLVTISACYGGGTRSYAGEGLVGLSWAFLRAGAHNVIGALWEASDASTPALMDGLYQGLEQGMTPSAALRNAKLGMLHSQGSFRQPFYWAPFQIYTGL